MSIFGVKRQDQQAKFDIGTTLLYHNGPKTAFGSFEILFLSFPFLPFETCEPVF